MSELGQFSTTLLTWAAVLHICKVDGWAQDFFSCNFGHGANSVLAQYMRDPVGDATSVLLFTTKILHCSRKIHNDMWNNCGKLFALL